MRWYRRPAVHFVALGLALLVVKRELAPAGERPVVVITPGRIGQLRADFQRETGQAPRPSDERVLVERAIEEEILYREALRYGFDRHDPSIMYRLTEKMRFVTDTEGADETPIDQDLYRKAVELGFDKHDALVRRIMVQKVRLMLAHQADERAPSEADLRGYYERNRSRYTQAARVSLWHAFVQAGQGNGAPERDAAALLERLRGGSILPAAAVRLGAPFPLGTHLESQSARDLQKVFGSEFAARVIAMEPGAWQGPVPSTHGLHLVLIEARQPERIATFDAVRSRVRAEYRAERRQAHLAEVMRQLRDKYVVRVAAVPGAQQG